MPTTSNGIHFEEHGDGSDTVLLLPGFGCSIQCWSDVARHLTGYRAILMDLPGHAGSRTTQVDATSLTSVAKPLHHACAELGLNQFAVVGLSLGGALGVRIALDRPESVTAVMAFMPWNAGGADPGDPFMQQLHDSHGDAEAVARIVATISLDPAATTDVRRTMTSGITRSFWRDWYGTGVYTSVAHELPNLNVPSCYVLGGRDAVAPRDKLIDDVEAIPGGRMVYLADQGHLAPYESPATVAVEISEFLGRHSTRGAPPTAKRAILR